jgi:hypothetical protein
MLESVIIMLESIKAGFENTVILYDCGASSKVGVVAPLNTTN